MKKPVSAIGTAIVHLFRGLFVFLLAMVACTPPNTHAASGNAHFPLYPVIQHNVAF
jgi:hypothetical protein